MDGENELLSAAVSTTVSVDTIKALTVPPAVLTFESLGHLYAQYQALLVNCDHRCPRGIRVLFQNYHFFHLVKLRKGFQTAFKMTVEEQAIVALAEGFGQYEIDARRAEQLSWLPDLIANPHEIYEYEDKKTADEVFIREYQRSGSPFKVFLCKREGECLVPVTAMTVKRQGIKEHRRGIKRWPKE
jgi:hypothetical protein